MEIAIEPVKVGEKEILRNLMEKYNYEFSLYDNMDVNNLGLYGYNYFDCYWTDKNRHAFFIKADGKLAGFIMINDHPAIKVETDHSVSEFFVMYKYRRHGIGKYAVNYILNKFKGKWQLRFHPKNVTSEKFWMKTINEYTKGNFKIIDNDPAALFPDGSIGKVLVFET